MAFQYQQDRDTHRVNHGALLADGQTPGRGKDDADDFGDKRFEAQDSGDLNSVEVALDLSRAHCDDVGRRL